MKLTRYFFISNRLNDLERFEHRLEQLQVVTPQMHLLTLDEGDAATHTHLHQVASFMQKDVVHSTLVAAAYGVAAAALVLVVSYFAGWTDTAVGWMPFIFLAIVVLGFVTWQGGLWGIQKTNVHFRAFETALKEGKHVFFVDIEPRHGSALEAMARDAPGVELATVARGAPSWIVFSQHRLKRFFTEVFP